MRVDIWVQSAGLGHVRRQLAMARWLMQLNFAQRKEIHFFTDANQGVRQTVESNEFAASVCPADLSEASALVRAAWANDKPDLFILDSVDYDQHPAVTELLNDSRVTGTAIYDAPNNRASDAPIAINVFPALADTAPPPLQDTQYLLGKDYFILAPEFSEYHARPRPVTASVQHAFAFFGGVDGNHFTPTFFDAVAQVDGIQWTLLMGVLYPHREWALAEIQRRSLPIQPIFELDDMARAFYDCDLALVAAGNTLVEAAAVGAPTIAFGQNEIQYENARYFERTCAAPCLGLYGTFGAHETANAIRQLANDHIQRAKVSTQLKRAVDGQGAVRVIETITAYMRHKKGAA